MKKLRIVLVAVAVVVVLWSAMLITDTVRSQNFQEPVFAKEIRVEADNDTIVYQGLGYTVKREFFANQNGERFCGCSEVWLFGILVSAVIT
ncbi:MAG: hypothetical protein IJ289_08285 [Clostridia bacterium]|nr:hypothetical protein [Clostridia bacterium]